MARLLDEYDVGEDKLREDISGLVGELKEAGLIRVEP